MAWQRERDNIRQLVSAYLDGELSPEDAAWVGRQISDNSRYAEVYRAYRGIRMEMRALPVPEVPPAVSAAVRAYTATAPPRRPVRTLRVRVARLTAAAATMAAAIAAIFTHGFGVPAQIGYTSGHSTPISIPVTNASTTATLANTKLAYGDVAQVQFSRPMDEATVKQDVRFAPLSNLTQPLAPSLLTYSPSTLTLSTTPFALKANTDYRVTIPKGLRDLQGNEVQNTTFDFSVGPPFAGALPTLAPTMIAPTMVAATDTAMPTLAPTVTAIPPMAEPDPATATAESDAATPEPGTAISVPTTVSAAVIADEPTATTARPTPKPLPTATTARVATATLAPAIPAATAPPAPAVPTPISAPAATATTAPKPANTAVPPTATIAPEPVPATATSAPPTATSVPATATTAPTPTPAITVQASFQGAYAQTANRLGAPKGAATAISGSQLKFQKGLMIYVPGRPFYVIYPGNSWQSVANPGGSGAAMANPSGGFVPGGAYGAAWTNAKLSGPLGYATTASESGVSGSIQSFDSGTILQVGGDVYVLFSNGTYQLFGA